MLHLSTSVPMPVVSVLFRTERLHEPILHQQESVLRNAIFFYRALPVVWADVASAV